MNKIMKTREIGSTGVHVGAIGIGTYPIAANDRPSEADGVAVIRHAIDCGVTFIDTANCYCIDEHDFGYSERLIKKALADLPADVCARIFIATKGGLTRPGGTWTLNGRPEAMRAACDKSLMDLGVDRIDLYQYHMIDPEVPMAETVGAMEELRDAGKIRFIGVSNFAVADLDSAQEVTEIASLQNRYSLVNRGPEEDGTLDACRERGLTFLPYCPLGGPEGASALGSDNDTIQGLADEHGVSTHQIALAWLLAKGPHVIPIPGTRRKETIEDSAKAADVALSTEAVAALDDAYAV